MKRYAVVIEKARRNYAAYVPDLPGCITTGRTRAIVERRIREAVAFHVEGMIEEGIPLPEPVTGCLYVEI